MTLRTTAVPPLAGAVLMAAALTAAVPADAASDFAPNVDAVGTITLPKADFRKDWSFLGAWSVDDDDREGAKAIHNVYAEREAVAYFRRHGRFPDGAVIIKELHHTATEPLTTGTASWASGLAGWFVMVKDAKDRFPGHPLWGDGWGWAFFNPAQPDKTETTSYKDDCIGCHVPAEKDDWLYIRGYPVLIKPGQ